MSVTPQFLDEIRARVPISDLVGRFVSWDTRKSQPAKGDYWAPCPFHSEKTASFHADNAKGFYYCFGCQAKGDAINFLKEKANMEFMDAVSELASMAGMQMPASDPKAREKADASSRLISMHEDAAQFFKLQLSSAAGGGAREYLLAKRRLSEKTIKDFGIGFIPNSRDALIVHLREKGFTDDEMITGGLALKPDEGGKIFDRFRNRIMFPIRDGRGRAVAFGGRAMDPNARAKYLNSSETPIFHKGRLLYNLGSARSNLRDGAHIIVAEGYMDVVALAQAGFATAVAPMGTAMTEDQLELVWRMDGAPLIALDGDKAGQRAAARLGDLALPKLGAARSLRFAMMPSGQDPDDVLRSEGAEGMRALLDAALPMVELLWREALGEAPLDTPEARTAFDARLRAVLGRISDQSLRNHYQSNFAERRRELFVPARGATSAPQGRNFSGNYGGGGGKFTPYKKTATLGPSRTSAMATHQGWDAELRVATVVKTLLAHPSIAQGFTEELSAMGCGHQALDGLRRAIVQCYGDEAMIVALNTPEASAIFKRYPSLVSFRDEERARETLAEMFVRFEREAAIVREIEDIRLETKMNGVSEALEKRLAAALKMREAPATANEGRDPHDEEHANFLRQFLETREGRE